MDIDKIIKVLKNKKQIVLQGAPGTGKTYITAELAVRMCDGSVPGNRNDLMKRYRQLIREGRIAFTTFHQSMDYEQFVEGFVPQILKSTGKEDESKMVYRPHVGIFKQICNNALKKPQETRAEKHLTVELASEFYSDLVQKIKAGIICALKTRNAEINVSVDDKDGIVTSTEKRPIGDKTSLNQIKDFIMVVNKRDSLPIPQHIRLIKKIGKDEGIGGNPNLIWAIMNWMFDELDKLPDTGVDNTPSNSHVLIIDEINRGNISKILGELITLLEADKRAGEDNCVSATLPYSNETFSVPSNLYIIGTMNTADRSVGYIDYAVRRRFAFITITSDRDIIKEHYEMLNSHDQNLGKDILNVYNKIENHIYTPGNISSDIKPEDIMVGHSYFLAKDRDDFSYKLQYEILPLLAEYHGDGLLNAKLDKETIKDIWPLK